MDFKTTVTENELELVKKIASKIYKQYWSHTMRDIMTLDDLYHTGIVGLLEAKRKPANQENNNPDAYKAIKIRYTILDFIREQPMVRVPKEKWHKVKEVRKARLKLMESGHETNIESIARHLGWPIETVEQADAIKLSIIKSLEGPQREDDAPFGVILEEEDLNPELHILSKDLADSIQKCLEKIEQRLDRIILICRLQHAIKLKALAQVMRRSIEGIRKKQLRAQAQMINCLETKGWSQDGLE